MSLMKITLSSQVLINLTLVTFCNDVQNVTQNILTETGQIVNSIDNPEIVKLHNSGNLKVIEVDKAQITQKNIKITNETDLLELLKENLDYTNGDKGLFDDVNEIFDKLKKTGGISDLEQKMIKQANLKKIDDGLFKNMKENKNGYYFTKYDKPGANTFLNSFELLVKSKVNNQARFCGLRAVLQEKHYSVLGSVIQMFLLENWTHPNFRNGKNIPKDDEKLIKETLDFCMEYEKEEFEKILEEKLQITFEELVNPSLEINMKISSILLAKSCYTGSMHPRISRKITHYGKFMSFQTNIFNIEKYYHPRLFECRNFLDKEFNELELTNHSNLVLSDSTSYLWKDITSSFRKDINCLLINRLKSANDNYNLFEDFNQEYNKEEIDKSGKNEIDAIDKESTANIIKNFPYMYNQLNFPRQIGMPNCINDCESTMKVLQLVLNKIYPSAKDNDKPIENYQFKDHLRKNSKDNNGTDYVLVIRQMAENGNIQAQYAMGQAYYFGNPNEGIQIDHERGLNYYRRAAQENRDAAADLGILHLQGKINDTSIEESITMLKKSAEEGSTQAMNALAFVYLHGQGTEIDLKESLRYSEMAAKDGHIDAMSNFASQSLLNPELNQKQEGIYWLKKALKAHGQFAYYLSGYLIANDLLTLDKIGLTCEEYSINSYNMITKLIIQTNSEKSFDLFSNGKYDEAAIRVAYGIFSGYARDSESLKYLLDKNLLQKIKPKYSKELLYLSLYGMQYLNNKTEKLNPMADLTYSGIQINDKVSVEKYENAYKIYDQSAKSKNSHYAKFSKGYMLESGLGVEKNQNEAQKVYDEQLYEITTGKEPLGSFVPTFLARLLLKLKMIFGYE